jgi:hypothetical protein
MNFIKSKIKNNQKIIKNNQGIDKQNTPGVHVL